MTVYYFIAALFILFGCIQIVVKGTRNKPLAFLAFFITASMIRPVTDSHGAWMVELVFIIIYASFKKSYAKDITWYLLFLFWVSLSFLYSDNPVRGIPSMVMYCFPLFYYALTLTAIKCYKDVYGLFYKISKSTWFLLVLSLLAFFNNYLPFSYYGMGICTIPAFLFLKTKKKQYIIHFLLCLLPALILVKRTPLLGIVSAMMVFSILMYKWKALIPSILILTLGILLVISIPRFRDKMFFGDSITSIQDLSRSDVHEVNMNGRLDFWGIVVDKYYERSPFFGSGIGSVKSYLQSGQNEYKSTFSLMHNDWLLVLCEQGLVGVILLLIFMFGMLRKCIKYSASKYPYDLRLISAACAGSIVSTMIHMFFENCMNSFIFSIAIVFYAILIVSAQFNRINCHY